MKLLNLFKILTVNSSVQLLFRISSLILAIVLINNLYYSKGLANAEPFFIFRFSIKFRPKTESLELTV